MPWEPTRFLRLKQPWGRLRNWERNNGKTGIRAVFRYKGGLAGMVAPGGHVVVGVAKLGARKNLRHGLPRRCAKDTLFKTSNYRNEVSRQTVKFIICLLRGLSKRFCVESPLKSAFSIGNERGICHDAIRRCFPTNTDNRLNYGPSLENVAFLHLVSNGYAVSFGKIGKLECDFIARKPDGEYAYIQAAYSLHGESEDASERIKEREYRPFRRIQDGYPRYIVSLDKHLDQREGVRHINAIDLLLGRTSI